MELNDDNFMTQWETIVADVHKTDIPLECVKKMVFKLQGGRQKTVNIHTLVKQGMEIEEIESMLTRMFADLDDQLRDVDFVVDISAVARIVQPETDKLLGKL
jgi:hypothetical protein